MHYAEDGTIQFDSMDDMREFFSHDVFATECVGAYIDSFDYETGEACVSMTLEERHLNAQGFPMGGALFSLCDFSLAIACNVGQLPSASVQHSIQFMSRIKGTHLVAKTRPLKKGRSLGFYHTELIDVDYNRVVATMEATCARTSH